MLGERAVEPHHRPRNADGAPAVTAEVGYRLAGGVEIHPGGRRRGGGFAEIDEGVAPVGEVNRHEPAAADVAAARLDDGERIADRYRGVDRVAAGREDADADRRSDALRGDHHAVLGLDRRRCRCRLTGEDRRQHRRDNDAPSHLRRARVSRS